MSARSYTQFCGLARALDTIGDRWSLLIVRELLVEPRRYAELHRRLPGVASNLLTDRLRAMESAGVIERRLGDPQDGVRYRLTPWGEALREPIDALIRWSTPLMAAGRGADSFHPEWLTVSLPALLHDRRADPPRQLTLDVEGTLLSVRVDQDGAHVTASAADPDDAVPIALEQLLAIAAGVGPSPPPSTDPRTGAGRLAELLA